MLIRSVGYYILLRRQHYISSFFRIFWSVLGKAAEPILQTLSRVHFVFVQFPRPNMGLQSASCGFSCVSQKVCQLSPNFRSWDLVHTGATSGWDVQLPILYSGHNSGSVLALILTTYETIVMQQVAQC